MTEHRFKAKWLYVLQQFSLLQSLISGFRRKTGHRALFALLISLVFGFSFQNCGNGGGIRFQSLSSLGLKSEVSSSGGTGNGQGTEGKPEGEYVRRLPGGVCDGKPLSVVNFSNDHISMKTLKTDTCEEVVESVDAARVAFSRIQKNVLAVDDGVYEKNERVIKNGSMIPEAWCQATSSQDHTQDVVIERDVASVLGNVELRVATQLNSSPVIRTAMGFSATRSLKNRMLTYESPSFLLTVDLHGTLSSGRGDYRGQLTFDLDGEHFDESVLCRIGGELDGAIWPSVIVAKDRAEQVYWFKDGDRVLYSSRNSNGVAELYLKSISTGVTEKISPPADLFRRNGVRDFLVSEDETKLLAATDLFDTPYAYQLYGVNLVGSLSASRTWTRLSALASGPNKSVSNDYHFDSAGKIVFRGASLSQFSDGEQYLFTVNFDGTDLLQMHANLGVDQETANVMYLPKMNKYLFQWGFGAVYDFALSEISMAEGQPPGYSFKSLGIISRISKGESLSWWNFKPLVTPDEKFLIFRTVGGPSAPFHTYLYEFATDRLSSVDIGNSFYCRFSDDGLFMATPTGTGSLGGSGLRIVNLLEAAAKSASSASTLSLDGELINYQWIPSSSQIAVESFDYARQVITRVVYDASKQTEIARMSWPGTPSSASTIWGVSPLVLDDGSGEYQFNVDPVAKKSHLRFISFSDKRVIDIPRAEIVGDKVTSIKFSSDKTKLIFLGDANADGEYELYVAYLDGQGIRQVSDRFQLFGGVVQFQTSNQTDKILFTSHKGAPNIQGPVQTFIWDGQ